MKALDSMEWVLLSMHRKEGYGVESGIKHHNSNPIIVSLKKISILLL